MLVGTKEDEIMQEAPIKQEEIEALVQDIGAVGYFPTSAKESKNLLAPLESGISAIVLKEFKKSNKCSVM